MAMPPEDRKPPNPPRREARAPRGKEPTASNSAAETAAKTAQRRGDPWLEPQQKVDPWPVVSRTFPLQPHAPQVSYDAEFDKLIRVAAAAGFDLGPKNAVNYETLLIAFAFCEDAASLFVQRTPGFRPEPFLETRKLGLDNNHKGTLYRLGDEMEWPPSEVLYSDSARRMLNSAAELCATVTGSPGLPLGTRHLLAAFLLRNPSEHVEDLSRCGLGAPEVPAAFLQFAQSTWPSERWQALQPRTAEATATASGTSQAAAVGVAARASYVASFGADDPSIQRRDLLDVRDEARAFARIAASRNTRLPLSVGVFGEWGSGKTFFMGLMSSHVDKLAKDAAKEGEKSLFLPDIVQIKFNAWHYIEINLWASLVEYIFAELDRKLQGQKPREQVEQLFEQLSTSRLLKLEAIDELIVKRRERKAAAERLDGARRDYEAALLRQSAVTSSDFWRAVFQTFNQKLAQTGDAERVKKLAGELGLKDLSESAGSLNEVLKEAETEAGRARVLQRAMVAQLGRAGWIAAVVAVLLVVPAGVVLLKELLELATGAAWIGKVNEGVLALSGLIAAVGGMIGKAVHSARRSLNELEGFRDRLDAAVKERTEAFKKQSGQAATFAEAERHIAKLKNEVEQAERKFAEADKLSDQVLRDYHSATARGRLNAFIRDKLASGDYAKHLGLIATIRKDFEQLSQLMADVGKDGKDSKEREKFLREHEEYRRRLAEKLEKAKKEEALSEAELAELGKDNVAPEPGLFTRIILYIDDLDRCPPPKVVDVLQAIHLLLYFPLFVVVVAVDARWVSRSLREQYPQLLAENIIAPRRQRASGASAGARDDQGDGADGQDEGRRDSNVLTAATSHDYLEKIFQIPYWVRPMDRDASMNYVKGIAAPDVRRAAAAPAAKGDGAAAPPPKSIPDASSPQGAVSPVAGTAPVSTPPTATVPPQAQQGTQAQAPQAGAQEEDETEEQAAYVAQSMALTDEEHKFLEALAPFVGSTPRRGLRFVNIYRLVKTGLSEKLQKELQEESNHLGYRALITQLAIVTGAPHISWTYFQLLENAARGIARRIAAPSAPAPAGEITIETLAKLYERLSVDLGAADGSQRLALLGALERLRALNEEKGLDAGPQLLLALDRFAPIARRYSFTARPH